MHLFATSRPALASGLPALLIDGKAVPGFYTAPQPDGTVAVSVMAHVYDAKHPNSYAARTVKIKPTELAALFQDYVEDPEAVLASVFGWRMQTYAAVPKAQAIPRHLLPVDMAAMLDLV